MIYHIYANRSNIGDWLSAKGIQKLLPHQEITACFCDEPFVEETMQTLSMATANDLIIIGGGGLLMDYFIPFWKAFQTVADRVPFVIWGIGYCDIKHEPSLPPNVLIEQIVNKAKLCVVRDELSRSHLPHCYLPEPVECPSINVIDPLTEFGNDVLHVVNYTTVTPEAYEAMCIVIKDFAETTGIIYRQTNNIVSKGNENELEGLLSLYKSSRIVVSSALHGCIIAVAMGLQVVAVSGDYKIDAFMKAVGLENWVINYTDVHLLTDMLASIYTQPKVTSNLHVIKKDNKTVAQKIHILLGV